MGPPPQTVAAQALRAALVQPSSLAEEAVHQDGEVERSEAAEAARSLDEELDEAGEPGKVRSRVRQGGGEPVQFLLVHRLGFREGQLPVQQVGMSPRVMG
jgi:hypothetical protein